MVAVPEKRPTLQVPGSHKNGFFCILQLTSPFNDMKMKRLVLTGIFMIVMYSCSFAQAGLTVRPYAKAGLNLLPPSLDDLSFSGGMIGADVKKNPLVAGLGCQFKLEKGDLGLGLDVGGGTLFVNKVMYDQGVGTSNYLDEEYDISLVFFAEKKLSGFAFVQGGIGPYFTPWYYEYYYESVNYTDVYDSYGGVAVTLGVMAAVGAEVPLSPNADFFILGKLEGIFQYGIMLPLTVNAGFSLKL